MGGRVMQLNLDLGLTVNRARKRKPETFGIFLSPEEFAREFYDGDRQHVYYMIRVGLIPAFKVGRRQWRIIPTLRIA